MPGLNPCLGDWYACRSMRLSIVQKRRFASHLLFAGLKYSCTGHGMSIDNICIHVLDDSFGSTLQIHVIIVHICIYAKPVCLKPAQHVGSKNAVFKQPNADRMAVPEYSSV